MLLKNEGAVPKEVLSTKEVPWPEIWNKARILSGQDKLKRANLPLPSIGDKIKAIHAISEKEKVYRQELKNHLDATEAPHGSPLQITVSKSTREYRSRLQVQSDLELYKEQSRISIPLLQEFESFLDHLGVWQYKFTTHSVAIAQNSETATFDSTYYMGSDGSTLRLKKANILDEGLNATICSPAFRAFFASEQYYKTFESKIKDNNHFLAPKQELALRPIHGFHPIEIFTQPHIAYVKGESKTKPYNLLGIRIGGNTDTNTKVANWSIEFVDPLAMIGAGGKDAYHEGDVINSVITY